MSLTDKNNSNKLIKYLFILRILALFKMKPNLPTLIEQYYQYPLKEVNVDFYRINDQDRDIIEKYYLNKLKFNDLNNSINSLKNLLEYIRTHTIKAKKMTVYVKGDKNQEDTLNYFVNIDYKSGYFTPLMNYTYLKKSNSFSLKANYLWLHLFSHNLDNKQLMENINKDIINKEKIKQIKKEKSKEDIEKDMIEKQMKEFVKFNQVYKPNDTNSNLNSNTNNCIENSNYYRKTDTENKKLKMIENEYTTGVNFKFNDLKQEVFLSNTSRFNNNTELTAKLSAYNRFQGVNLHQTVLHNKISLKKNFVNRPFLFRDYPLFDKANNLTLTFGHKLINNYLDFSTSSKLLLAGTPSQDSLKYIGLTYRLDEVLNPNRKIFKLKELNTIDILNNNLSRNNNKENEADNVNKDSFDVENLLQNTVYNFKASLKLNNSINSKFLSTSLFYRRFITLNEYLTWQFNFEAKNTFLLSNTRLLKSHETNINDDFKGVLSPSPKLNTPENESIGTLNTIKLYNKVYFTNASFRLFNNKDDKDESMDTNEELSKEINKSERLDHQIIPFIHFNMLYHYKDIQKKFVSRARVPVESSTTLDKVDLNTTNTYNETEIRNTESNTASDVHSPLYYSAGFGLSYFTEFIALEGYYNAFVKKNNNDIGLEFGFNIGLD